MMSDRRVVVVRDVGALKKDARSAVERYLEKPSADVLLLLVETHGGKTDRELARRSTVLEFASLAGDRVPRWITHYSSTELATEITQEAAERSAMSCIRSRQSWISSRASATGVRLQKKP